MALKENMPLPFVAMSTEPDPQACIRKRKLPELPESPELPVLLQRMKHALAGAVFDHLGESESEKHQYKSHLSNLDIKLDVDYRGNYIEYDEAKGQYKYLYTVIDQSCEAQPEIGPFFTDVYELVVYQNGVGSVQVDVYDKRTEKNVTLTVEFYARSGNGDRNVSSTCDNRRTRDN